MTSNPLPNPPRPRQPLLDLEGGVEREWDRLEALPRDMRAITVQQLIAQDPNNVLANIKAGIVKVWCLLRGGRWGWTAAVIGSGIHSMRLLRQSQPAG